MRDCHTALKDLRRIRRGKLGARHGALLDLIEQKEEELMAMHRKALSIGPEAESPASVARTPRSPSSAEGG
jgi:hypothetical protein